VHHLVERRRTELEQPRRLPLDTACLDERLANQLRLEGGDGIAEVQPLRRDLADRQLVPGLDSKGDGQLVELDGLPRLSTTARSTAFSSSRTFPGHE